MTSSAPLYISTDYLVHYKSDQIEQAALQLKSMINVLTKCEKFLIVSITNTFTEVIERYKWTGIKAYALCSFYGSSSAHQCYDKYLKTRQDCGDTNNYGNINPADDVLCYITVVFTNE